MDFQPGNQRGSTVDELMDTVTPLSTSEKLDLLGKLSLSIQADLRNEDRLFFGLAGSWNQGESEEKIIAGIKEGKHLPTQRESLD